ncbi:MAG: imidazole glycerol phosphate synthase subunit HisH [Thermodesulfovibrio sp.]|nr:imidazole glycerol phosphate synthase subunit HisH [Thermodesulfovibrio sp.]MDW7998292.1 imidazole glycerol phosphate synthase subunit HisH [Thermodesulfovibrio sp.]
MKSIVIVNYGMGNIYSLSSAIRFLGYEPILSSEERDILEADYLFLPGVGSFYNAMKKIVSIGLDQILKIAVYDKKIPLLGICLGMQLLAQRGTEDGESEGLGFIEGSVERFQQIDKKIKIPHIGFSPTTITKDDKIFEGIDKKADFYYNHSYRVICPEEYVIATAINGEPFVAAIKKDNVYGTQFHPELSQSNGLRLIKNFLKLKDAV